MEEVIVTVGSSHRTPIAWIGEKKSQFKTGKSTKYFIQFQNISISVTICRFFCRQNSEPFIYYFELSIILI